MNITYDANGNIANDGTATYSWNARNQLAGRGGVSFQYDAYGRRVLNSAGNNLLYQGLDVTQELSGTAPIANWIVGGTDEFFVRSDSTGAYSPLTDVLGSALGLVNSSGTLATQYTYDPFGNTTSAGSASSSPFQYTGRENEGNGLYYDRARYYSPTFGRFISEDPIGFNGGNTNLYSYALNSPTNFIDPTGLSVSCYLTQNSGQVWCVNNDNGRTVVDTTGYSGRGPGLDNPSWNGVPDWGPTPTGTWDILPGRDGRTGPMSLPLRPHPDNSVFDPTHSARDPNSFLWHGDNSSRNHSASEGCFITDPRTRYTINSLGGGTLDVSPIAACVTPQLAHRKNNACTGGCTPKPQPR